MGRAGRVRLLIAFPLYYVVALSFTSYTQYIKSAGFVLLPSPVSLDGYVQFLTNPAVPKAFGVTLYLTLFGTALNILTTAMFAYPLSRREMPCRKFFTLFALFPMLFSGGADPDVLRRAPDRHHEHHLGHDPAVPDFDLRHDDRSFFLSVAGRLLRGGGAHRRRGEMTILFRVIMPLSKPVLATVILMYGVGHWNCFFPALYYVRNADLQPLQVVLRGILNEAQSTLEEVNPDVTAASQAMKQAAVVLSALRW